MSETSKAKWEAILWCVIVLSVTTCTAVTTVSDNQVRVAELECAATQPKETGQ